MANISDQYYRWRKWSISRWLLVIFFLAQLAMIADAFSQSVVLATRILLTSRFISLKTGVR